MRQRDGESVRSLVGAAAPVVAIAVVIAGAVTVLGSLIDDSVRRLWWLVVSVGVLAGLLAAFGESVVARFAPRREADGDADPDPTQRVVVGTDDPTVPKGASIAAVAASFIPLPEPVTASQVGGPGFEALSVPKQAHTADELEDAWAADHAQGRFALSDGASSAYMSKNWARLLTAGFVELPERFDDGALREWLRVATQQWSRELAIDGPASAAWWAAESASRGSDATLVGLEVSTSGSGRWRAWAVGDSCVVHLRADRGALHRMMSFPLDRADAFDRHPDLVSTLNSESQILPRVQRISGSYEFGDVFLLMSDALAEWALSIERSDASVWSWLASADEHDFGVLVSSARSAGQLHDDDTTLLRVVPGGRRT